MSIADLFESGEMKEHKGAFRNLVMIARADGLISEEELKMLQRMAKRLNLTTDQMTEIIDNPSAYPMQPPIGMQDRKERLIDLVRMMMVDGEIDSREMVALHKCAIGLGHHHSDVAILVNRIHHFIRIGLDRDGVIEAMLGEQA